MRQFKDSHRVVADRHLAALRQRHDECEEEVPETVINTHRSRFDSAAIAACCELLSDSSGPKRIQGIHTWIRVAARVGARSASFVELLNATSRGCFADCIIETPHQSVFKFLKHLTDPTRLSGADVPGLFRRVVRRLVDFFRDQLPELEGTMWVNGVTATKNACRILANLVIAHPLFSDALAGTADRIFGFLNRLDDCSTEEFLVRECFPAWSEAERSSKYNRNHYLILTVAGALAFVEAAIPFGISPAVFDSFIAALRFGSLYLTNYALKVIERITMEPEFVEPFATPPFLSLYFELMNVPKRQIDLWYILQVEVARDRSQNAKRRWLHTGFHALGILKNFCRTHDSSLVDQLVKLGLLEFDFMAHSNDTDIIRQFFGIVKHVIKTTPTYATMCIEHPLMEAIFQNWEAWSFGERTVIVNAIAFLLSESDAPFGELLLARHPSLLATLVDTLQAEVVVSQKTVILAAILRMVDECRTDAGLLAPLFECDLAGVDDPELEEGLALLMTKLEELQPDSV